jgi:putative tryptophan/tyrosine transport system substrate-binding protein
MKSADFDTGERYDVKSYNAADLCYRAALEVQTMRRREFITLISSAIVAPRLAHAQASKVPTIGVLWHAGSADEEGDYYTGLLEGFRRLGYVDGRTIQFEHRFPNEKAELFRSMAAELVALKIDVLVTVGTQTAPYARDATDTIPVVFVFVPDPVGSGFVESLGRPGRNMTGLSHFGTDIVLKRLQFLAEMVPDLRRVALLVNPDTEVAPLYKRVTETAAADLGLENHTFEARSAGELERALDAMTQAGMQAVTINGEGLAYQHRTNIAKMAVDRRLPLGVWSRETFKAGALMSYGTDQVAMCRRAPAFVDKILKGAKPGDLPVEQPTKLDFLINLSVARTLGLTVPPTLLALTDEVIG